MAEKNAYAVLNLRKGASQEEIKKAYIELVKKFDPERHTDRFMVIQKAYERLRDSRKRAHEDVFTFNVVPGQFAFSEEERHFSPNLDQQIVECQEQVDANPADETARRQLADLYMKRSYARIQKKLWRDAIEDWERLLALDPTHHRAKNNLTYALIQLGHSYALHSLVDEAAANWERSLHFNPDNPAVIHNMALALEQGGRKEKAGKYWDEILRLWKAELDKNPDDEYLRERVIEVHKFHGGRAAVSREGEGSKKAIKEYSEILKIAPDDFEAKYQIAVTRMNERNFKQAVESLRELHQSHPKNVEALNMLGWAYLNTGDHDRAFQAWRRSLSIDPENQDTKQCIIRARMELARSFRDRGQFTYALVHYKELMRLLPGSEEVRMEIAKTFERRGDKRSAEREYRQMIEKNPSCRAARKALSELRMGRG